MIVEHSAQHGYRLLEAEDTRRFKVVLRDADPVAGDGDGVVIDGDDALVPIDLVPRLPGAPADADWRTHAYLPMVEKAAEFGWIDRERNAIRAHVERLPDESAGR